MGPDRGTTHPVGVFIVGSCVSRDTFEFLDPRSFELRGYVARQSLISAFAPASPLPQEISSLSSRFQSRMTTDDALSSMPSALISSAPRTELLLWDLVDERLGVFEYADGAFSTDSVELRGARTAKPRGVHHAFGSPMHRRLFREALASWRALLLELGLKDRALLVAPPWAERAVDGTAAPPSFGVKAEDANTALRDYVQMAVDVVGVRVIGSDGPVLAEPYHKWGSSPFHYDDQTYLRLAGGIVGATTHDGASPGYPGASRDTSPVLATTMRRTDAPQSITVHQSGRRQITAKIHHPDGRAFAFHLYTGRTALEKRHYGPQSESAFDLPPSTTGPYYVRAFVMDEQRNRTPLVSERIRLG